MKPQRRRILMVLLIASASAVSLGCAGSPGSMNFGRGRSVTVESDKAALAQFRKLDKQLRAAGYERREYTEGPCPLATYTRSDRGSAEIQLLFTKDEETGKSSVSWSVNDENYDRGLKLCDRTMYAWMGAEPPG